MLIRPELKQESFGERLLFLCNFTNGLMPICMLVKELEKEQANIVYNKLNHKNKHLISIRTFESSKLVLPPKPEKKGFIRPILKRKS